MMHDGLFKIEFSCKGVGSKQNIYVWLFTKLPITVFPPGAWMLRSPQVVHQPMKGSGLLPRRKMERAKKQLAGASKSQSKHRWKDVVVVYLMILSGEMKVCTKKIEIDVCIAKAGRIKTPPP